MSQTIHLQKLHLQEMDMVFLWMWLVSLMIRWMGVAGGFDDTEYLGGEQASVRSTWLQLCAHRVVSYDTLVSYDSCMATGAYMFFYHCTIMYMLYMHVCPQPDTQCQQLLFSIHTRSLSQDILNEHQGASTWT